MGVSTKGVARKSAKAPREVIPDDKLKSDPKNYRLHPPRNQELIRRSLEEIGGFRSIAVDGDNIIRAGNGVYEQAEALGMKVRIVDSAPDELIAVRRKDLTGDEARRAALFDNQAGTTSEWDFEQLADTLANESELLEGIFQQSELNTLARVETVAQEQVQHLAHSYYIIVECTSEEQQLNLLEKFTEEGLTCRAAS